MYIMIAAAIIAAVLFYIGIKAEGSTKILLCCGGWLASLSPSWFVRTHSVVGMLIFVAGTATAMIILRRSMWNVMKHRPGDGYDGGDDDHLRKSL